MPAFCSSLSCSGYIRCCSIRAVGHWISFSLNTSGGILLKAAAFWFLIFVSTTLSSSWVNYPILMSSLLINFCDRVNCTFREFCKQILETFFPHVYLFFLAGSFYFSSGGSLPFTHFICVCHVIQDCLSCIEFLILLIWFWMFQFFSFYHTYIYIYLYICIYKLR